MDREKEINGKIVRVTSGDITELDVDGFVFYATPDLKLGTGVGNAVSLRGGQKILEELNQIGEKAVGEAVATGAGKLKADCIIHAVGPGFQEEDTPEKLRRVSRFYFRHYVENQDYFQIFWAIENQSVIGELPSSMVEEVTKLWERNLRILERIIEEGVREGFFLDYDPWEVANILWTLANGVIQTERSAPRRRLRQRALDRVFEDAIDLVLRGLAKPAGG